MVQSVDQYIGENHTKDIGIELPESFVVEARTNL